MNPALAAAIADGIVAAIKAAEGQLSKEDVLKVIEDAMRAESEAKMEHQFAGQVP